VVEDLEQHTKPRFVRSSPCCEVSEHATHRSSPHGPWEPSARVTGRARTYATDLPKLDSTLPEAASERDQCSPHHLHRLPCYSTSLLHYCHPDMTVPHNPGLSTPSYNATSTRTGAPHTTRTAFVATQCPQDMTSPLPWHVDEPSLASIPGCSLAPKELTACLTPTHWTRRTISRHSPSPTSHDASTS
jgi:hypothetical protein